MSEHLTDRFTNPDERQQTAIKWLNIALGEMAVAFGVNADDVNELAGGAVEDVINRLADEGKAA